MKPAAEISLNSFLIRTRIGAGAAERRRLQTLRFDLKVFLQRAPKACRSDRLDETICYDTLAQTMVRVCQERSGCRLLEYLGSEVAKALRPLLPTGSELELSVTKLRPPIQNLQGGATFTVRIKGGPTRQRRRQS